MDGAGPAALPVQGHRAKPECPPPISRPLFVINFSSRHGWNQYASGLCWSRQTRDLDTIVSIGIVKMVAVEKNGNRLERGHGHAGDSRSAGIAAAGRRRGADMQSRWFVAAGLTAGEAKNRWPLWELIGLRQEFSGARPRCCKVRDRSVFWRERREMSLSGHQKLGSRLAAQQKSALLADRRRSGNGVRGSNLYCDERDITSIDPSNVARDIAMVFQNYALYPHMTVFENMAYGAAHSRRLSREDISRRVQR